MAFEELRKRLARSACGLAAVTGLLLAMFGPVPAASAQGEADLSAVDFAIVPQARHRDAVEDIILFNDDRLAVSIAETGEPFVWEVRTGRLLRKLAGPATNLRQAAIDHRTNRLTAVDNDTGELFVWNLLSGELDYRSGPAEQYVPERVLIQAFGDIRFSEDGARVLVGLPQDILVWEFAAGAISFITPEQLATEYGLSSRTEGQSWRARRLIEGTRPPFAVDTSQSVAELSPDRPSIVTANAIAAGPIDLPLPIAAATDRWSRLQYDAAWCERSSRLAAAYYARVENRGVLQVVAYDVSEDGEHRLIAQDRVALPAAWPRFPSRGQIGIQFTPDCSATYLTHGASSSLVDLERQQNTRVSSESFFGPAVFSTDGQFLATGSSEGWVYFRDLRDRQSTEQFSANEAALPFGTQLGLAEQSFWFFGLGANAQWSLTTGEPLPVEDSDALRDLLQHKTGILSNRGGNIEFRRSAAEPAQTVLKGPFLSQPLALSKDAPFIAVAKRKDGDAAGVWLQLWNFEEGTLVGEIEHPIADKRSAGAEPSGFISDDEQLAVSPNGRLLLYRIDRTANDPFLSESHWIVWDVASGTRVFEQRLVGVQGDRSATFIGEQDLLVLDGEKIERLSFSGGSDPRVVWSKRHEDQAGFVTFGEELLVSPTNDRFLITVPRPQGTVLFDPRGTPVIMDAERGTPIAVLKGDAEERYLKVQFTADGRRVFASDGALLRVLDARNGQIIRELSLPERISHLTPFDDGRRALITFAGSTTSLWDVERDERIADFYQFTDGEWVTILPSGHFTASENGARHLNLVAGQTALAVDQVFAELYRPELVAWALSTDKSGLVERYGDRTSVGELLATGAPPDLALTLPGGNVRSARSGTASVVFERPDFETEAREIKLGLTIEDRGGGAGQIVWRADEVAIEPLAVEQKRRQDGMLEVVATIPLKSGDNVISAAVYNSRKTLLSGTVATSVRSRASKQQPKLHIIALGVDEYRDPSLRLNFAASDAQNIVAALCEAAGGVSGGVGQTAVTGGTAVPCGLAGEGGLYREVRTYIATDGAVTREGIANLFDQAAANQAIGPDDVFVLFVAGHGVAIDGRYYFLPADHPPIEGSLVEQNQIVRQNAISQSDFEQWLRAIPAQKALLLYDTCESGALIRFERSVTQDRARKAAVRQLARGTGRWVLTASTETTPAREGLYGRFGAFTFAVLEALGDGDANADGFINITELAGTVTNRLPEITEQAFGAAQVQVPTFGTPPGQGGAAFPFVGRKQVSALATDFIPRASTHVLLADAIPGVVEGTTCAAPATGATDAELLKRGTQVRLVTELGAFVAIARDGKLLGCVSSSDVLEVI